MITYGSLTIDQSSPPQNERPSSDQQQMAMLVFPWTEYVNACVAVAELVLFRYFLDTSRA